MVKNEQCILSSLNDITQRKRTENQLRETLAYLESLLDYANAPIIVWDTDYRITKFNHAFERLTGRSFEDVAGKQLDLLFPERTKRISLDHIFRTAKGIRWETIEIDVQHVDGSLRTILWNSANVYDSDNKNIVATIAQGHDITERKAAEAQIVQLNAELEEQVSRRTAELHKTIADLEEQSRVFIGRELRIIELSKLVSQLESQLSGKTNQE